jgi:predicted PurR-regulated permease PerM
MDSADSIKPRLAHCYLVNVMIGGALLGAPGALIAIPVAETLRLLFEELRDHQVEAAASPPTVSTRG